MVYRRIGTIRESKTTQSQKQSSLFDNIFTSSDLTRRLPFPRFYKFSNRSLQHSNFDFTDDEGMCSTSHGVTTRKMKSSTIKESI